MTKPNINKKPKTVLYRRKRESRTNYCKRLKLLLSGEPRLVFRLTNHKIIAQIISFNVKGDKVVAALDSSALKQFGWNYSYNNLPAAYLAGMHLGKLASKKGCKKAILDTGFRSLIKGGKITAFLRGMIDGGVNVPHRDDKIFPSTERISGKHIQDYAIKLRGSNLEQYKKEFSSYLKNHLTPEVMVEEFKKVKTKLEGK